MAKISESLSDFIPQLPQIRGIVERFGARMGEDSWPQFLNFMGETAADSIKWAIKESGIQSRSGYLLDSVKYDMASSEYGTLDVDAIYASVLDKGMDIREYMTSGQVVGMDIPGKGTMFRTVNQTPTVTGRNWTIKPHRFMEAAKSLTGEALVQVVDELSNLASPESAANYVMPTEELPELSAKTWALFFPELSEKEELFHKQTSEYNIDEILGSRIVGSNLISDIEWEELASEMFERSGTRLSEFTAGDTTSDMIAEAMEEFI